jgi:hypothetical protein
MSKLVIVLIGFLASFFTSLMVAKIKEAIGAGETVHSEIYRLRGDIAGVRNLLIVANGLLAAIVAALIF